MALLLLGCARLPFAGSPEDAATADAAAVSPALYRNARQLTFAGRRSGEGYFGPQGRDLVFQSEREDGNPFYQIYRTTLETGETRRISPGTGKTTCAWIHPDGERVLFASTHLDPEAVAKQEAELEARAQGTTGRYSWDYDPSFDLFVREADGSTTRLTRARGYDAEASFSPNGRYVAFASNRHAFDGALDATERERLAIHAQSFIDLYLLDTETSEILRLTDTPGYDGGPFFSPDGERITWRRFTPDGATAEIMTIRLDGTDERQLTTLGAMSWAPYYHPSGDYLIFATNLQGFANFELYLVDAEGRREPVRVTERERFDSLASFSPDGNRLSWTSNRTSTGGSQIFVADWDDAAARAALDLAPAVGAPIASPTRPAIDPDDLALRVAELTAAQTEGRATGSAGEEIAAAALAHALAAAGLRPAGDDGGWEHAFEFTAGVSLGRDNALTFGTVPVAHAASRHAPPGHAGGTDVHAAPSERDAPVTTLAPDPTVVLDRDWRPLAFSRSGLFATGPVVFAGYGVVAPADEVHSAVDDYATLDVSGKWVMVLRDLPQDLESDRRRTLRRHAGLRYKAMVARDRGARGVLFVSGPRGRFRDELAPLRFDASLAGTRVAVLSITDALADRLLAEGGSTDDLAALHARADAALAAGEPPPAVALDGLAMEVRVDLETRRATGRNVLGRLQVGPEPSSQQIVIGAHYDHLGRGEGSGSLADASEAGLIHPGADDNASGTAVMVELAEYLAARRRQGFDLGTRDFVFAAWSGEELGLLGSNAWVAENVHPHGGDAGPIAYLNFDMVGRLRDDLVVQGLGSSAAWAGLLESAAAPLDLSIYPQQDSYIPTDATSFYTSGVPILAAFTGVHADYHKPSDTLEKLNLEGAARIGQLFARVAESVGRSAAPPEYRAQKAPSSGSGRGGFRVYLGTVPDYARTDLVGVALSGVQGGSPAERAGLRRDDVIVEAAGRTVENIYDFTFALEEMQVGEPTRVVVRRGDERLELEIVPASRE